MADKTSDNNKSSVSPDPPNYRVLGESGLIEDEDGNTLSASEMEELFPKQELGGSSHTSAFHGFGVSSVLDDKANPAHWYYYYDERFCGPSREDYMEKMAQKYRESAKLGPKRKTAPDASGSTKEPFLLVPEEVMEKADKDQEEVNRCRIRPTYRKDPILLNGLNFVAVKDVNGHVIVSNEKYRDVDFYYNGLARAQNRKTRKFGFVDRHGKEVIPCIWRSAGQFSEYLAGVQNNTGKSGFIDVTGHLVILCTWKEAWPFHEGLARVQDHNNKIGMIDQQGKIVIPCVWRGMGYFSEGLASFMDDSGKCGYMDRTGKIVIPSRWKNAWTFSEGLAIVQDFNKRLGYIDKSGELVIPCRWKKASYFRNGQAKVSDSKSIFLKDIWVYIDKQGREVDQIV